MKKSYRVVLGDHQFPNFQISVIIYDVEDSFFASYEAEKRNPGCYTRKVEPFGA